MAVAILRAHHMLVNTHGEIVNWNAVFNGLGPNVFEKLEVGDADLNPDPPWYYENDL